MLLPTRPAQGPCRICSETHLLTEEHIPPQAAFNWDTAQRHSGEEVLTVGPGSDLGPGVQHQGGISAYTLCASCNSLTGTRYGTEYATWAQAIHRAFEQVPPDPEGDNDTQTHYYEVNIGKAELYPGRFIRQTLSTLASVSGGELTRRAPLLKDALLAGTQAELPEDMGVFLALFPDRNHGRILPPMAEIDVASHEVALLCDFIHYPFAFVLVLAGREHARVTGADVSWMLRYPEHEMVTGFYLHTPIARCHTVFPGDYRSLAQLRADIAASSSPRTTEGVPDPP